MRVKQFGGKDEGCLLRGTFGFETELAAPNCWEKDTQSEDLPTLRAPLNQVVSTSLEEALRFVAARMGEWK